MKRAERDVTAAYKKGRVEGGDDKCYFFFRHVVKMDDLPSKMCGSISFFTYPKGFSRVSADKKTCTYTGPCQDVDISKKGWQKELKYERPKYPCQVFIGITKARLFA